MARKIDQKDSLSLPHSFSATSEQLKKTGRNKWDGFPQKRLIARVKGTFSLVKHGRQGGAVHADGE
jgi:hypothetical protein